MKRRKFVKDGALVIGALPLSSHAWSSVYKSTGNVPDADVLVYGATPAGICAAIGASREGAKVVILEPTSHIGGVNTGGLSFSDSSQVMREAMGGLWREWHERIAQDYRHRNVNLPYEVNKVNGSPWTYEPHVAMRVTMEMLEEANVEVRIDSPIQTLEKQDTKIQSVETVSGEIFNSSQFIDATYEGDLMDMAEVDWVIGRESRDEFDESLAGKLFGKPIMDISGYDEKGDLLPLITTDYRGLEGEGDDHVMTYSFRLCVTNNPENRIPFPEPENYDPRRFELVRRYFRDVFPTQEQRRVLWDFYELPSGKYDANNSIMSQFSMGMIGASDEWSTADWVRRQEIWEQHKAYTVEFYHFLTNDSSVPDEHKEILSSYGLCKDEFESSGHWPVQLYVREGRRMRGEMIFTQNDIQKYPKKSNSICVSSFPIDSHDCQRIALNNGQVVNEGMMYLGHEPGTLHGTPHQVPYEAILPKKQQCSNLIVPVALSATHVAYSSIRVEPTWMTLGHSAGIAAALSASGKCAVQDLNYAKLSKSLISQKQILDFE